MQRIQVRIKASFGEIVIEGNGPHEILDTIRSMPSEFITEIDGLVYEKLASPLKTQLNGIVEFTTEGPIITTREKLTHYEAIAITLYASEEKKNTAGQISRLFEASGIKSMVPARLNEMTKRGAVFKPNPARPEFKLTTQGQKWIEEEVLPRLKKVT